MNFEFLPMQKKRAKNVSIIKYKSSQHSRDTNWNKTTTGKYCTALVFET